MLQDLLRPSRTGEASSGKLSGKLKVTQAYITSRRPKIFSYK